MRSGTGGTAVPPRLGVTRSVGRVRPGLPRAPLGLQFLVCGRYRPGHLPGSSLALRSGTGDFFVVAVYCVTGTGNESITVVKEKLP